MDKRRRNDIEAVQALLCDLRERIETARDDEQNAFENMPEGLQASDRGQAMETAIEALESAIALMEEAESFLTDALA
jgi:hypothetical protein